jgi:hypothetical protein
MGQRLTTGGESVGYGTVNVILEMDPMMVRHALLSSDYDLSVKLKNTFYRDFY